MIQLHFKVKVRVNIPFIGRKDIATIEDTKDVTGVLVTILSNVVPRTVASLLPDLGRLPAPIKLYDDRGVLIELR